MYKKSILSVAIASSLMLTGCFENNKLDDENAGALTTPPVTATSGSAYPAFNPAVQDFPIPSDILFSTNTNGDGTFGVTPSNPVTAALDVLSGSSTVAPIDIKILSGDVKNSTLAANVRLIELEYASGSPVQGLSVGEPPKIIGPVTDITVSHIELDGDSYIRINPTKPLKPLTRYIVVVTNGVTDSNDEPLVRNPGPASYGALSDLDVPLANPALAGLKKLINEFWEPIAMGTLGITNEKDIVLSYSLTTSGDEKVLEYIANPTEYFNDLITNFVGISTVKKVQATFGKETPSPFDANSNGKLDYAEISSLIGSAIGAFPNNPFDPSDTKIAEALEQIETAFPLLDCNGVTSGPDYINCIGAFFANIPQNRGGLADLLPKPKARTVTTTIANQPVSLVSAAVSPLVKVENALTPPLVSQGTIDVPFYLGIPTGNTAAEGDVINDQSWVADDVLASALNKVLQGLSPDAALAQGKAETVDEEGNFTGTFTDPKSTVVNYLFPFPKQSDGDTSSDEVVDDLTIPWLAVRPYPGQENKGTVIFQHGITTDRSAALSVGTILAQAGFTVIAIDQVAHGVAPKSTEKRLELAETLLTAGQLQGLPVDPSDETTKQALVDGNFTQGFVVAALLDANPNTPDPATTATNTINFVLGGGDSGNPLLNIAIRTLTAFENTVANAGSTIPGIAPSDYERHFNFTSNAAARPTPMVLDTDNVDNAFGSSGSLYINLSGFTNSRDKNRQGVVDLLNLRESLAAIDLDGNTNNNPDVDANNVFFSGHSLGTAVGIPFVTVANSSPVGDIIASSFLEPASGITRMLENSSSFGPTILGGLAGGAQIFQGTYSFEAYMNTLQATLDSVDPINFADNLGGLATGSYQTNAASNGTLTILNAGTLGDNGLTENPSDVTNVIEAETVQLTTQFGTALPSYFAGVEKFAAQLGAIDVIGATIDATRDHIRTRLAFGKHGMFVLPSDPGANDVSQTSKALQSDAFNEGLIQTTQFFLNTISVADTSGATSVDDILIGDADYNGRTLKQLNP